MGKREFKDSQVLKELRQCGVVVVVVDGIRIGSQGVAYRPREVPETL